MAEQSVSEFFGGYARDFDAIYGNRHSALNAIINRLFRKSMMRRFENSLAACRPIEGRTVLDIGCGPGHYSIALARAGASKVVGLDFAEGMLDVARKHAADANVGEKCQFINADFLTYEAPEKFDYAVIMGVMDYIEDPRKFVEKVVSVTRGKAVFSFPVDGGFLAWQRKLRYRKRCALYLYTRRDVEEIFRGLPARVTIDPIARDFFVTADVAAAAQSAAA